MASTLLEAIKRGVVLFDGAMGTELIRRGLSRGQCPETWNLTNPAAVEEVHRGYFSAGAQVVTTNSFGGHPLKLMAHGLESQTEEINRAAARIAAGVRQKGYFVAGSMGPTGKLLKPYGPLEEAEAEEGYFRQARALAEGGVDAFLIETMYDLREAVVALRGAKKAAPSLPVFVTMTFQQTPRGFFTLMGQRVGDCLGTLEAGGADVVGSNCTLSSQEMAELVSLMRAETSLPLLVKPNAGQPKTSSEGELIYAQTVEEFIAPFPDMLQAGIQAIGGCCGTTPEHIRRLAELIGRK